MSIIRNGKGFRNNINVYQPKIGLDRKKEIFDDITNKNTFLPNPVTIEDMDQSFIEFVKKDLELSLDNEKVPVTFYTIQRWQEFSKNWESSDTYKNIKIPFISIVRNPDIQEGTNYAGLWNIPGDRTYTYLKSQTNDGARKGVDLYKIPQPTSVDLTYEVRLFTNRMKDLNEFSSIVRRAFKARQFYISVKGHPMPLISESTGDESNIDDFENRRYYVVTYEIKLLGYIMEADDMEVIPSINRAVVSFKIDEGRLLNQVIFDPMIRENTVTYTVVFKPRSEPQFSFIGKYDIQFTQLVNIENISRIVIQVNSLTVFDGTILTDPIVIRANDNVNIKIYKNYLLTGKFQLLGNTI